MTDVKEDFIQDLEELLKKYDELCFEDQWKDLEYLVKKHSVKLEAKDIFGHLWDLGGCYDGKD